MFGFIFVALGLSLATALVENGIEIYPLFKSDTTSSFEVLSESHFQNPTILSGLNQIKLQINHENKDHILQFNKNELFHPEFTVSAANANEINDITKAVNNWISKDCYYHSKHGAISLCDGLEGAVKLDNVNYKVYSFKKDSNQMQFFIHKKSDSITDHTNNYDIDSLDINRRELLPNGYPTCDGGYWDSTNTKKTAYISMFVAVSPRLQKYNHYTADWQTFSSIPALVAARVNAFQQNYHNMGFDSSQFTEATITLNFKLKHLHIMDAESDTAYTNAYDVKAYVDANNLEDLYGPWSLGAMFIYGTDWPNGVADYPNSDSGAKPDSACTFGCALFCTICSDNPYYATDPEREFNMEHEGGHNLGATHDPYCAISSGQPTGKDVSCGTNPSVMCSSGGYGMELPKGVGCSYDEMSCCIDNILQISDCLDSPFDFTSYTNSDTDCISVEEISGNDLIVKCMGNLRITASKLIHTIPIVNHFKIEFSISINTLPNGWTNILNVGAIDTNTADRYPGIFIYFDGTNWYFQVGITNNPTVPSESWIRCQSQTLTLPVTDIPVIIEADQTNNLFTITVNGNVCTDSISGALSFSGAIGLHKNIYIPNGLGDPILNDGTIKDLIFTLYETTMNPTISPSQAPTITYCQSIQRYYGTSLISECLGDVNMKSGTLIDTIPLVNHFKIEFELSISTLNIGFTNILFIGSANGDVSDRYPSIFIYNDGNFGNTYFQIGITKSGSSETFIRCESQKFGLPIVAMPIVIEIDGSMLFVTINGNQCSDSVSNSPISYTATGLKNIYIPNLGGILSGGSIQNLVITMYDEITECILGTNYWFEGNQVYAKGDPHFRMWNGDYHDYQGVESINNQYYYITRDQNSNSKDLPFNILGKHYYWVDSDTQMRALDYITIQLFDSNKDYYLIFLQYNILKYTTNSFPFTTSTLYNSIDTSLLSTFNIGIEQKIGKLFSAQITSQTTDTIHFTLTIGGTCQLTLYMQNIGSPKASINNRYVQDLYINPPNCYKCFITGLFGDFKRPNVGTGVHREGRKAEIPLCNGGYKNIKAGWTTPKTTDPMVHNTAFDANGLSYDKTFCDRGPNTRRRILNNEYIIGTPDDFIYIDLCPSNSETAQLTITECENIRTQYDSTICASDAMKIICDSLQSNCEYDACVMANDNTSKVLDAVENIFGNSLGFLQTIPNIVNLYNADDIVAEPGAPTDNPTKGPTKGPTDNPTNGPTIEPTEIVIAETTKYKEINFAQKMNIYRLLYVVFGLCLFQIII